MSKRPKYTLPNQQFMSVPEEPVLPPALTHRNLNPKRPQLLDYKTMLQKNFVEALNKHKNPSVASEESDEEEEEETAEPPKEEENTDLEREEGNYIRGEDGELILLEDHNVDD